MYSTKKKKRKGKEIKPIDLNFNIQGAKENQKFAVTACINLTS